MYFPNFSRTVLGIFPEIFSQTATSQPSQGYFPKLELPNCAISQAATNGGGGWYFVTFLEDDPLLWEL